MNDLMHRVRFVLALLVMVSLGCSDRVHEERDTSIGAVYKEGAPKHDDGSGRYYMGREIARITDHGSADWLDRPSRASAELPARVITALELNPADVVADIGAGTGYFTLRLCEEVPYGRVYAVDVQEEMLAHLKTRVERHGYENVVPVHGSVVNPNLPPSSFDLVLMVDAYHEFSHPREMMQNVVKALKPGGRVAVVEYRAEDPTIPVKVVHRMSEQQVRLEMEAVGLRWRETRDILPQQHFIVFEKPLEP